MGLVVRQEWLQLRGGGYASDSQEAWSELPRPADSSSQDSVELVVCPQAPPSLPRDACWAPGNTHSSTLAFQASTRCTWLPDFLRGHLIL